MQQITIVISGTDENIENAGEGQVLVIDSSDSSLDISIDITPKKLPLSKKSSILEGAIKRRIKNVSLSIQTMQATAMITRLSLCRSMVARVTAPRTVLHFCSKRCYFERILRFCNLVGEIEQDLVESRRKAEKVTEL